MWKILRTPKGIAFLFFILIGLFFFRGVQFEKLEDLLGDYCFGRGRLKASCYINQTKLNQKIKQGLPQWAKAQIRSDLEKFKPFKTSDVDQLHQDFPMLFRFKIKDGRLETSYQAGLEIHSAFKPMVVIFDYLAKHGYIKEADFLMGLSDLFKPQVPQKLSVPIFVFAKDMSDSFEQQSVPVPDWMNIVQSPFIRKEIQEGIKKWPWAAKKPLLFWRGGSIASTNFRERLVELSKQYPNLIDAKFSRTPGVPFVTRADHLQYQYLISIDGIRATWTRLVWHLQSNSLVFKHDSHQIQWFYSALKPYVHYVPVQDDEDSLLKNLKWASENPQAVQAIIQQAQAFAEDHLSLEDMCHYYIGLLVEYQKMLIKKEM